MKALPRPLRPEQVRVDIVALSALIKGRGLKQYWVAEEAGINEKTLARLLNGKYRSMHIQNVERIAKALGIRVVEILNEDQR